MTILKSLSFKVLLLLITLFILNFISYASIKLFKLNDNKNYSAAYEKQTKIVINDNTFNVGHANISPHPYFGYVKSNNDPHSIPNNYGFKSNYNYPYKKNENEFVIGIFGGSVAEQFYSRGCKAVKELLENSSKLEGKKITCLNFALPALKQPQSFIISSYFVETYDLAITIDGYNEIVPRAKHRTNTYTPDSNTPFIYPNYYELFNTQNKSEVLQQGQKYFLENIFANITRKIKKNSFLNDKALTFIAWFSFKKTIHKLQTLNNGVVYKANDNPVITNNSSDERVNIWKKYTLLQSYINKQSNKKSIFFIQPNHNYKNSKPLHKSEYLNDLIAPSINHSYPIMEDFATQNIKKGIHHYSLTKIFKGNSNKIFLDSAHLNKEGNIIMAEQVYKYILLSKILD